MGNDESVKYHLLLEEARIKYNKIDETYKNIKNRMLLFLTLDVAILTYFFADIRDCLPTELYGIIFFGIGVISILISTGILFAHYRAVCNWPTPIGPLEVEKIENAQYEKEVLRVAIDDYDAASTEANRIVEKHAKAANWALLLFSAGVIILLIIKFF